MLYMVTFTINIPPMLAYLPYMDPMGVSLPEDFFPFCRHERSRAGNPVVTGLT